MSTFVLIHGSYDGGHLWRDIAAQLEENGHRVTTPTLTGFGERAHLLTREVGLDTHIKDIEAHLYFNDISEAIVLGFSYGGMVVAGLGEEVANRVKAVILLDAALPLDGESIREVYQKVPDDVLPDEVRKLHHAPRDPDALVLPVPGWLTDPRAVPFPLNSHFDHVTRGPLFDADRNRYYFLCTQWAMNDICADRARKEGWTVREIDSPHDAMLSAPASLLTLLEAVSSELAAPESRL